MPCQPAVATVTANFNTQSRGGNNRRDVLAQVAYSCLFTLAHGLVLGLRLWEIVVVASPDCRRSFSEAPRFTRLGLHSLWLGTPIPGIVDSRVHHRGY